MFFFRTRRQHESITVRTTSTFCYSSCAPTHSEDKHTRLSAEQNVFLLKKQRWKSFTSDMHIDSKTRRDTVSLSPYRFQFCSQRVPQNYILHTLILLWLDKPTHTVKTLWWWFYVKKRSTETKKNLPNHPHPLWFPLVFFSCSASHNFQSVHFTSPTFVVG